MTTINNAKPLNHSRVFIEIAYAPAVITFLLLVYARVAKGDSLLGNPATETFILYLLLGQFIENRLRLNSNKPPQNHQ